MPEVRDRDLSEAEDAAEAPHKEAVAYGALSFTPLVVYILCYLSPQLFTDVTPHGRKVNVNQDLKTTYQYG